MENSVSGTAPLKRKMRQTPPVQGERAKKIPTDKSRDFVNGGNLQYERAAAKVGKVSKHTSNVSLESPRFPVVVLLAKGHLHKQKWPR